MRTIFKYTIGIGTSTLFLPPNSLIKSVMMQNSDMVLYAEVDGDKEPTEGHTIYVYGTGWPLNHNGSITKFLGTLQRPDGTVWHVYFC